MEETRATTSINDFLYSKICNTCDRTKIWIFLFYCSSKFGILKKQHKIVKKDITMILLSFFIFLNVILQKHPKWFLNDKNKDKATEVKASQLESLLLISLF